MKEVIRTETPTLEQLAAMAANLREYYYKSATVDITAWAHSNGHSEVEFNIWVNDTHASAVDSWQKLQDVYFSLMENSI